jgi:hypothetical protein
MSVQHEIKERFDRMFEAVRAGEDLSLTPIQMRHEINCYLHELIDDNARLAAIACIDPRHDEHGHTTCGEVERLNRALSDVTSRAEAEHDRAERFRFMAGACLGGTDPADRIASEATGSYDAHDRAYKMFRESNDATLDAYIKPLRERAERSEAYAVPAIEALREAVAFITGDLNLNCRVGESDRDCYNRCRKEWLDKTRAVLDRHPPGTDTVRIEPSYENETFSLSDAALREIARKHALDAVAPIGSRANRSDMTVMQNVVRQEEIIFYAMKEARESLHQALLDHDKASAAFDKFLEGYPAGAVPSQYDAFMAGAKWFHAI